MATHRYDQQSEIPEVAEYRQLRVNCGLSPKTVEAAARGLPNSLYATTIRHQGRLIAMGRVVGDGGCNFEIVDIAVHPDYQRKGLGGLVMEAIMSYLRDSAPESAYVSLIADYDSPALYSKFGFEPTTPISIGMALKIQTGSAERIVAALGSRGLLLASTMMSEFVEYLHEVFAEFGSIQTRKMFGGHGVFFDGLMIGLVADDMLYLKVDKQSEPEFRVRRLPQFQYLKGDKAVGMSYYLAPEDALDNASEMRVWAQRAHEAALRSRR